MCIGSGCQFLSSSEHYNGVLDERRADTEDMKAGSGRFPRGRRDQLESSGQFHLEQPKSFVFAARSPLSLSYLLVIEVRSEVQADITERCIFLQLSASFGHNTAVHLPIKLYFIQCWVV